MIRTATKALFKTALPKFATRNLVLPQRALFSTGPFERNNSKVIKEAT